MASVFLGIDIGTSGVRSVAFDIEGRQRESAVREYPLLYLDNGGAEQNPDQIFNLTLETIRETAEKCSAAGDTLEGMGFCSQMHSLLAVNIRGEAITELLTWADLRAAPESSIIEKNWNVKDLNQRTGCRVQHPMYPLSKILRMKRENPDVFARVGKFISIKEYILHRLTGVYLSDMTSASSQGLYNIHTHTWDSMILHDILGIKEDKLAETAECTRLLGGIKREYARFLGIPCELPVTLGTGDGIAANIGCGVRDSSSYSSSLGTSGAIRTLVTKPLIDPQMRTWCYAFTDNSWVAGGAINNGGLVLEWLKNLFPSETGRLSFSELNDLASSVPPGSSGLHFLPFLTGERCPNWNAGMRGMIHGLTIHHRQQHFIRAAMEGVMFRLLSVFQVIAGSQDTAASLIAGGGYTRSKTWLKIQADIFNKEIRLPGIKEAAALGAAFLSMVSRGAVESLTSRLPVMDSFSVISPDEEIAAAYRGFFRKHIDIYNRNTG